MAAASQGRTPTSTVSCTQFTDNYAGSSSLGNYGYYDVNWNSSSASALFYSVGTNELDQTPSGATGYSYLLVNNAQFPQSLSSYTQEGDFKLDAAAQGVFGLVFLANGSGKQGYIFQWNGLNSRWEIEKQTGPGYYYVSTNSSPAYGLGNWVHLKVVVSGNNFAGFETSETGPGTGLGATVTIFNGVSDPGTTAPYASGAAGIRSYNVVSGNTLHIANYTAYTCGVAPTNTATSTNTPTSTLTATVSSTFTPTRTTQARCTRSVSPWTMKSNTAWPCRMSASNSPGR